MKTLLPILLALFPIFLFAQLPEKHAQVSLQIDRPDLIQHLNENGFEIDHAHKHSSDQLEMIITHSELAMLENMAIPFQVLIEDVAQDFENNILQMGVLPELDCGLNNFDSGSMGGYHTYDDMIQHINNMATNYPELVSISEIGTSIEGRIIYAVKISDNVATNESAEEGVAYYDAITHAREPMGLETILYYMWTLLENYGTDPEYTYLVDHRELYFVPIVNPDGYVFNQSTNPNGGGLWRKNRRDNGNNCFGIDLNRNYAFGWGNPAGSSGDICSNTYRGTEAFSEPESAAVRDFTNMIQPAAAYSCHTYSDVFLCPNGFNDELLRYEDYAEFASEALPEFYRGYGNWVQMIGYYGAGTTHDYLNDQGALAYTPEIGHTFWESPFLICDRIQEMLPSMKYLSWISGDVARFHDFELLNPNVIWEDQTSELKIRLKNRGLSKTAQNVTVELSSDNPAISFSNSTLNYGDILQEQFADNQIDPFIFTIIEEVQVGQKLEIKVKVFQDGNLSDEETINLYAGEIFVDFMEDGENGTNQWITSNNFVWDSTFMDANNGDHCITDSRYGNFNPNTTASIKKMTPFDLSSTINPFLEFNAKWSLEPNSDFVRVRISSNGGSTWTALQGEHTTVVSGQQSYTNNKHWVQERIDLSAYASMTDLLIDFQIQTDGSVQGDGFYFDDLRIVDYFHPDMVATQELEEANLYFDIFPNPAQDQLNVHLKDNNFNAFDITLYDTQGKVILFQKNQQQNTSISLESLSNGVYWIKLKNQEISGLKKVIVLR